MGPPWADALLAASLITLVGTPLVRRLALAADFVDSPGEHKSHPRATPYLGGVALTVAVSVGVLFAPSAPPEVAVVILAAALIAVIGLVDDHRTVNPAWRFLAEVAVGLGVAAAGIRVHATGIVWLDVAITVIWIVGVTNAVNLLDNMDGLAAGVTAAAGSAILVLAVLGGQATTGAIAAGLVGGCLGFLVYNRPPASIFMGDTGSLFLGFTLAVLTIDVNPSLVPPASFLVPLMLLALPVLDTGTVTFARLRRGLNPAQGGRDHLSHRLVARGLSRGWAVATLVTAELAVGAAAVVAGRHVVPLGWSMLFTVAVLGTLIVVTARAPVYECPIVGLPRRLRLALVGLGLGVPLLAAPAVLAVVQAEASARAGARHTATALQALETGDVDGAAAAFRRASESAANAEERLDGPLTSLGLAVPGVASNLRAARTVVSVSRELTGTYGRLAAIGDFQRLPLSSTSLPVDDIRRLAASLDQASSSLEAASTELNAADRPYLLDDLSDALHTLKRDVARQAVESRAVAAFAKAVPALVGRDGPRRYLIVIQDNSSLSAIPGYSRVWGQLAADNGHLAITGFEPSDRLPAPAEGVVSSSTTSPDFPTAARGLIDAYLTTGRPPVDGVISLDLAGLASLSEFSGAVTVPERPASIPASHLVDAATTEGLDTPGSAAERARFVRDVATAVLTSFGNSDFGNPMRLVSILGPAVRGDHLRLYLTRAQEESLVTRAGAGGAMPAVTGDSLMVVSRTASADAGTYLRRRIRYAVHLDTGSQPARLAGRLEVVLENNAPARQVALGAAPSDAKDTIQTELAVYSPFWAQRATVDGEPVQLHSVDAFGRYVHSTDVALAPGQKRILRIDLAGRIQLGRGDWFSLDLLHQASLAADDVEASITAPEAWRIAETSGLRRSGSREARVVMQQQEDRSLRVRLEHDGVGGIWDRMWRQP